MNPRVSETHGGRSKRFSWEYQPVTNRLAIENEDGLEHQYELSEIHQVLKRLEEQFGDQSFPLGNNVEKLYDGTEVPGLGTTILELKPGNIRHAQGASYLGVVLEECGYLMWNQKKRGIEWRLVLTELRKESIARRLGTA